MSQLPPTLRGSEAMPWFARAEWMLGLLAAWLLLTAGWCPLTLPPPS